MTMMTAVKDFLREEDGVTAIEYGLIAALIGVAIAVVAGTVGDQLVTIFNTVKAHLTNAAT